MIDLYDATSIDRLEWPNTPLGRSVRGLLLPLIKNETSTYIENVQTQMVLLKSGEAVLPITVNDREYENSYVVSNYCCIPILEEKLRRLRMGKALLPFVHGMGFLLKWAKANKVVMVNNWLFSTNLYPVLSPDQVQEMIAFLTQKYPDHTLMFRSLNPCKNHDLLCSLQQMKCRLVPIRQIFIYTPEGELAKHPRRDVKRDAKLFEEKGVQVLRHEQITPEHLPQILELYRLLYVQKHTSLSPIFTPAFLRLILENRSAEIVALVKGERIEGATIFFKTDQEMMVPFCGYNTHLPESFDLYRMLTSLAMQEAHKSGLDLNYSSGASSFKTHRGLIPFQEYIAIYDRHLPIQRRTLWAVTEKIIGKKKID